MKKIIVFLLASYIGTALGNPPQWMDAPEKWCKKSRLCAIGQGESYALATADARQAMSKIFETKIQSSFTTTEGLEGSSSTMSMREEINEATEGIISGIEILERYNDNDTTYVIAAINKMKTANVIKGQIDKIDDEMKSHKDSKKSNAATKMKKLYNERFPLVQSYQFLTGMKLPASVSLDEIRKKARELTNNIIVRLKLDDNTNGEITSILRESLILEGYKIASSERDKRTTHNVIGKISSKEEYLKVSGFKKYSFTIDIQVKNDMERKTGAMTYSVTTMGRNYEQSLEKALPQLKKYITENIDKLNFE